MKDIIKNNRFLNKVLLLTSGTIAGQLLVILTMPFITRIYSPDSFGIYNVISSVVAILAVMVSLKFEISIPLIKDENKRNNIIILSFISIISISFISLLVLYLNDIFELFDMNVYFYFIPISTLFIGVYQLLVNISVFNNTLKEISITKFNQSFIQVFIQLTGSLFNGATIFLFMGFLLGKFSGIIKLIRVNKISIKLYKFFNKDLLLETVKEYKKFPIYSLPSSFINSLGVNIVPILLLTLYGPGVAGMYALSNRIISAPMQLIGKSFNNALFSEAPNLNLIQLRNFFWKTVRNLFLITSLPVILVYLLEPLFFTKIFGEEWKTAGEMLRILIFMFWFQFSIIPMSEILTILNKQEVRLYWDIIRLLIVLCSLIIPYSVGFNITITLVIYSISMILCYLVLLFLCGKVLKGGRQ